MQGLERIVLEQPFFAGLGPEFGVAISGCARNLRFAAGDYLVRIHKGRLFSGIGKAGLDGFRCERRPFVF